jgi:hypothetical protein
MAGRPAPAPASSSTLRLEILKEIQQLVESREARDRLEKSPIAEAKGREHWVLHLLLRAQESTQARTDNLIGTAYTNMMGRLGELEQRLDRIERSTAGSEAELKSHLEALETKLAARVDRAMTEGLAKLLTGVNQQLAESFQEKWKPIGDSVDTFATGSKQMLKDVADTYRVATQTRLLLNENARRITDLGRDLVALEESLKLVLAKTLEEGLAGFEQRIAPQESTNGTPSHGEHRGDNTAQG